MDGGSVHINDALISRTGRPARNVKARLQCLRETKKSSFFGVKVPGRSLSVLHRIPHAHVGRVLNPLIELFLQGSPIRNRFRINSAVDKTVFLQIAPVTLNSAFGCRPPGPAGSGQDPQRLAKPLERRVESDMLLAM